MSTKKIEVPGLKALKACWLVGAIIAILSYFCAIVVSCAGGYPLRCDPWDGNGSNSFKCEKQLDNRREKLSEINSDLDAVEKRIDHFTKALKKKEDRAFVQARVELEREKRKKAALTDEKKGLIANPIFPSAFGELAFLLVAFGIVFLIARRILKDATKTFHRTLDLKRVWIKPYLLIAGVLIFCTLVEQVWVSVLDPQKSWFGWCSFCVSPWGFVLIRLTYAMDQFAITYVFTVIYLLTDEQYVPPIELDNPDGRCGVGKYVYLFQKWTFIGLVVAIIPIVWWLREITVSPAWFEKAYLITPVSSLGVIAYLVSRVIRRAYLLRRKYQEACTNKMGSSWSAQKAKNLPPDPTREFLGDKWWKLPAVVTAVITAALAALKVLGITNILVNQLLY